MLAKTTKTRRKGNVKRGGFLTVGVLGQFGNSLEACLYTCCST